MKVIRHKANAVERMIVFIFKVVEFFKKEEIVAFREKNWLFVYSPIKHVVEGILKNKARASGHIKIVSSLDCLVKMSEDRPHFLE